MVMMTWPWFIFRVTNTGNPVLLDIGFLEAQYWLGTGICGVTNDLTDWLLGTSALA